MPGAPRRLDEVELGYLFLDGSHFNYHANAAAEPVLAAWGLDTPGKPVFVGLEAATSPSGDAWEGILTGLGDRGLACPLLGVSGAPGLIGAVSINRIKRSLQPGFYTTPGTPPPAVHEARPGPASSSAPSWLTAWVRGLTALRRVTCCARIGLRSSGMPAAVNVDHPPRTGGHRPAGE
jgi:hypothetical protein